MLPDIIHDHIDKRDFYKTVADRVYLLVVVSFAAFLAYTQDARYFLMMVMYMCIIYPIYTLYSISTTLPDCNMGNCVYTKYFEKITKMGSCNHLNISGHMLVAGTLLFLMSMHSKHRYWAVFLAIYIVEFFFVAASRNHYTVDCITSTFVLALLITNHGALRSALM